MAAKQIPATIRKVIATRMSQKFKDVVSITEVPTPKPGDGQILVKNRYTVCYEKNLNLCYKVSESGMRIASCVHVVQIVCLCELFLCPKVKHETN